MTGIVTAPCAVQDLGGNLNSCAHTGMITFSKKPRHLPRDFDMLWHVPLSKLHITMVSGCSGRERLGKLGGGGRRRSY